MEVSKLMDEVFDVADLGDDYEVYALDHLGDLIYLKASSISITIAFDGICWRARVSADVLTIGNGSDYDKHMIRLFGVNELVNKMFEKGATTQTIEVASIESYATYREQFGALCEILPAVKQAWDTVMQKHAGSTDILIS